MKPINILNSQHVNLRLLILYLKRNDIVRVLRKSWKEISYITRIL